VLFFAILFGLSMDYQVFLVSRMHEEWIHTGDNDRAVNVGVVETGGITAAAARLDLRIRRLLAQRRSRHQADRTRALERDLHRRVHPAHGDGAGRDAPSW
jgi:hypothetical protein